MRHFEFILREFCKKFSPAMPKYVQVSDIQLKPKIKKVCVQVFKLEYTCIRGA